MPDDQTRGYTVADVAARYRVGEDKVAGLGPPRRVGSGQRGRVPQR